MSVPLKYFSSFWRTLRMSLINCEISLILTWFNKLLLLSSATEATEFAVTKAKLYVLVVTLSTEDNIKLWKLI